MRELRASKRAADDQRIFTAGEKEWLAWQYRQDHGCPVPPALQRQMTKLRDRWSLDYSFPWDTE